MSTTFQAPSPAPAAGSFRPHLSGARAGGQLSAAQERDLRERLARWARSGRMAC